jgi:Mce-associated membrane protein
VPSSRRPRPGDRPRPPRVAGLRKRATQQHSVQPLPKSGTESASTDSPPDDSLTSSPDTNGSGLPAAPNSIEPDATESEQVIVFRAGVVDSRDSTVDTEAHSVHAESPPDAPNTLPGSDAAEPSEARESKGTEGDLPPRSGNRYLLLTSVLLLLTALCSVLAFWFYSEAHALRDKGPGANQALTDAAGTSAVNGQITNAVQQVFSYDFANTAKTENAAKNLLVGPAIQQYSELFATVKQLAPEQKLVVTTTVRTSAVTRLQGDRAQVLLFVDQNAVRTDNGQSNVGPAQISVTAVLQGNQWKIEQIMQR